MSSQNGPGAERTPQVDPFEPMEALKWGFDVYRSDIAKVALPVVAVETLVLFASTVVPKLLGSILRSALQVGPPAPMLVFATILEYAAGTLLGILATAYAAASLYPYLLNLGRGRPVELSEAFRPGPHFLNALKLAGLLVPATTIGFMLCALPGIAVVVVSTTAFPALVDRDLDPLTALRESLEHARAHFLPMLFFGLSCIVVLLIGAALCAVGAVLVSVPVVMLAQVYVYLHLAGEIPVDADLT